MLRRLVPGTSGGLRWVAYLVFGLLFPVQSAAADSDVMFVIDNSAAMRTNDPGYRAPQAIIDSIYRLRRGTRVGVVLFDSEPTLAAPLTEVTRANRPSLMAATDLVRYKGRRTNPAAGLERAIYHLRFDGRADAQKWIVLVSDGRVEIGNRRRNRDLQKWLEEDLAQSAADSGIRIIGLGFTEGQDHRVLHDLATKTQGEFLPIFSDGDITRGFARAVELVNAGSPAEPPMPSEALAEAEQADRSGLEAAERVAPPAPSTGSAGRTESGLLRSPVAITLGAIVVGGGLLLGIVMLFVVRSRAPQRPTGPIRKAILIDRSGVSGRQRYDLEGEPIVLGRRAADPHLARQTIIIDRRTVSRRHAVISFRDFSYWIADQGTKNGTFVNGERVVGQRKLEHGDVIVLEDFSFEFRVPDEDEADRTLLRGEDEDATVFKSDEVEIGNEEVDPRPSATGSGPVIG